MSGERMHFSTFHDIEKLPIRLGNGQFLYASGIDIINVIARNEKTQEERVLPEALYAPGLKFNLSSMNVALLKGLRFESNNSACKFTRDNKTVVVGKKSANSNLFIMKIKIHNKIKTTF